MPGNMIQEYLVGLGVKIDRPGFNELNNTINATTRTVESATSGWRREFVAAAGVVSASLAGITTAVGGLMKNVAQQDLAMEKLARNMMVSKDAAWEMKKATDALGESINDIAITPELMDRYQKLIADGKNMKVGGDFAQTMRSFRDLMFEFTRFKQEVSYAMTWVGYYLLKYLNRPLAEAQAKFRSFNDAFVRNMSVWTEKAARALVYIINIGLHFATFIKEVTTNIYDMWMAFPRGIKIATAAVTAFFALIKMSPMGRMITLVSTLLVLLDDYFGYFEGKDALLGQYWEKLHRFIGIAKEKILEFADAAEPVLETFIEYVKIGAGAVMDMGRWIMEVADEVRNSVAFEEFCQTFERLGRALYNLGSGIIDVVVSAIGTLEESFDHNESGERFTGLMDTLYHIFLGLVDVISYCIEVLAGWLEEIAQSETVRDFLDAVVELFTAFWELIDAIATLVKTVMVEFFHDMDDTEPIFDFRDALRLVVKVITAMIRAVSWVIKKLAKFLKMMARSETFKNFWRDLGRAVKEFGKIFGSVIDWAIDKLGRFGRALKALVAGDFKGAVAALFGSSGSGTPGSVGEREKKAYRMLKAAGYSDENAAGIMARLKQEHNFDTSDVPIHYEPGVGEVGGFGIAQWDPDRRANLENWANENSKNPNDFTTQMQFLIKEAGEYGASPDDMDGMSARESARYWTKKYEIGVPSDNDEQYADDYEATIQAGNFSKDTDVIGGSGSSFRDDSGHIRKWSSAEGMDTPWNHNDVTDTSHFQPGTVRFLNALLAMAYNKGYQYTITGGSEKGYHASGTYSHENGYKVDISDEGLSEEEISLLERIVSQFHGEMNHEAGHYDITIYPSPDDGDDYGGNSLIGTGNPLRRIRHYSRGVANGMNSLLGGVDPVLASGMTGGSPGAITNYGATNNTYNTYQVNVGGVNVAQTNANPAEIGQAVADQSIDALQRRGQYIYKNRVLTGGQNLV